MSQVANTKNDNSQIALDFLEKLQQFTASQGGTDPSSPLPPSGEGGAAGNEALLPKLPKGELASLGVALDILLEAIGEKERKTELNAGMSQVKANTDRKADQNKKILEKAQENLEKLEKAGFWDKFAKAFSWIGAIAAVVVSAALVATGVGAVAVAGLVVACVALANQVLDTAGQAVNGQGWGLTSLAAKGLSQICGKDSEMWIKLGLDIALAIVGMVVSCGASGAKLADTAGKIAQSAIRVGAAVQTTAQLAGGATTIASASYTYSAATTQADQKRLQKILEELQMMNELITKHLENTVKEGEKLTETVSEIVKEHAAAQMAIMSNTGGPSGMA